MDNEKLYDSLARYRQSTPVSDLSEDFENRVFAKIKKKKTQRKVTASVGLAVMVAGFLFIAQATIFNPSVDSRRPLMARPAAIEKEEIPIVEDVVFASSDSRSSYVIEQVNYTGDDGTI